jgi:glycosyltransferase involved in cell wall biosynthesis
MNACTIIAKNYVGQARVLAQTFAEQHPGSRLTTLVLDDFDGYLDPATEPFDVLSPADLDLPEFERMASSYDVLELSTAVKPWLLRRLLRSSDHVIYLDPDIRVYAPFDEVADLARAHGMVLTPHNVAAMPRDGHKPSETDILIAGAYNLGFIALGARPESEEFIDWWSERLLEDCIVDPDRGFFVDQRWIDLVPGMVPDVHFLRDPGYNVAYWNLATRDVRHEPGGYTVNGRPLRFFHFSGYDPERADLLSKHQDRIDLRDVPVVHELCDAYAAELLASGHAEARAWPYSYAALPSGLPIERAMRRLYVAGLSAGDLDQSLFTPSGEEAFVQYASGPAGPGVLQDLSRYLHAVWQTRDDLRAAMSLGDEGGVARLREWSREAGPGTRRERHALIRPDEIEGGEPFGDWRNRAPAAGRFGVNVVGYLRAELGVGEVARQAIGALDAAEVPLIPSGLVASASRQGHDFGSAAGLATPFAFNLLCVNADMTPTFAEEAGPGFFEGRHTIGWWWWEVSHFPKRWASSFELVDELWAGSHFVAETLRAAGDVPVHRIPMPVGLRPGLRPARDRLGLPGGFVFLFVYDYNSVLERKNPLGLIESFRRAFAPGDGPALVLKSINSANHRQAHEQVVRAAGGHPDIHFMDDYLPAADKDALIESCDCYVSLHRSEGFGITMAEAMLLGKPVIATGYSGNRDFMHEDNSFLVDHDLVAVGLENDPYPAEAQWAQPDLEHAARLMREVVDAPDEAARRARAGRAYVERHHSPAAAGAEMRRRLRTIEADLPPAGLRDGSGARAATLELSNRGPERSGRPRWHPTRALRALALRAGRPLLTYGHEVDQALLWSLEQSVCAEREEAQVQQAALLAHVRRLERRLEAVEGSADDNPERSRSEAHA